MEATYDVVWPGSARGAQLHRKAARLTSLDNKRVVFLWDYVFRRDELFPILEAELKNRFNGIDVVGYEEFGNLQGADDKARVGRLPDLSGPVFVGADSATSRKISSTLAASSGPEEPPGDLRTDLHKAASGCVDRK